MTRPFVREQPLVARLDDGGSHVALLVHERAFFRLAGEQGCPHSEGEVLESIDNPDQRIVSDVDSFTNAALNFTVVFLGAGLRVASFGKILYDI